MTIIGNVSASNGGVNPATVNPINSRRVGRREIDIAWLLEDFEDVFEDQLPGPRVGAEIVRDH